MTDTAFSLGEIERLVAGHHHDPHSILGAHPGPEGVVVRALRPVGASVTVILDDGRRFPMTPLGRGVFTVTLPEEKVPDYRLATVYRGERADEAVADDPYRYLPMIGEFDLYLIGEGRHEELWRVLGAHVREAGQVTGTSLRGVGAERPRRPGHRRLQLLGRPRLPDALAGRVRRVGAVHPRRGRRRPVQVRGVRPGRRVAEKGRPARDRDRAPARHGVGGVHLPACLGRRGLGGGTSPGGSRCASR